MLERLSLRLRVFLIFAGLAGAGIATVAGGLWAGFVRAGGGAAPEPFVQAGLIAGFLLLGLVAGVWYLFDLNVAKPIEGIAGSLRARAHAEVAGGIDAAPARYLGDLAPAASAAALTLAETRNALAEAVARETARLSDEKERLEALLADVPVGVLLCSGDHQVVFYNGQAVDFLGAGGLDRPVFAYLREGPLRHAHDRLVEGGDADAATDLVCATPDGERVFAARMRLAAGGGGARPGYVLTLRDVTGDIAREARREGLLGETVEGMRRRAANLRTLMGVRGEVGGDPARIEAAIGSEVDALAEAITDLGRRYEEGRAESAPLGMTRGTDLMDSLRARIEAAGAAASAESDPILVRCSAFEIIALVEGLSARIAGAGLSRSFRLSLAEDGPGAMLRLEWDGAPLTVRQLDAWLGEPAGEGSATGQAILAAHRTEAWPEHKPGGVSAFCLPFPQARRAGRRPKPVVRSVVYDFDLLAKARSQSVSEERLDALTYVVFDTETTGLLPGQGDEIVQIAGVRIVNGRRVDGEVLDLLVNPGRPIPAGSTEVHGITDAMVAEAPRVEEALRSFHRFAEGAVLIAHNAPFDMEFLRRREAALGLRFDHPILDTVLLSAVVFGQHEGHSLDALCHRLGITIPDEERHTAIGDTRATADAFLRMMPMLKARGLGTFGGVLTEVRRHGRLLRDLN